MPDFRKAVITNKGIALNAKAQDGRCAIQFTKASTGSGMHAASEDLAAMTALSSLKQNFSFDRKEYQAPNTVMLRLTINNQGLMEGYRICEFGIYATDPDEGEILYSVAVPVEGHEDVLPAYAESGLVTMTVENYVTVSNAETVTIVTGTGVYALADDMTELREDERQFKTDIRREFTQYTEDMDADFETFKDEVDQRMKGDGSLFISADSYISVDYSRVRDIREEV